MYIIDHTRKLVIIIFPKSGCSTIRLAYANLFFSELNDHDKNEFIKKYDSIYNSHHFATNEDEDLDLRTLDDYYKICIYRNTYKRLVSTFLDKVVNFKSEVGDNKHIPYYNARKTFKSFIEYINDSTHEFLDIHFRHQTVQDVHIDEFIDIDNIYNDLLIGRPDLRSIYLSHLSKNPINKLYNTTDEPVECLEDYDFEEDKYNIYKKGKAPPYSSFYSHNLIEQIKDIYKEEINKFGIQYPYQNNLS